MYSSCLTPIKIASREIMRQVHDACPDRIHAISTHLRTDNVPHSRGSDRGQWLPCPGLAQFAPGRHTANRVIPSFIVGVGGRGGHACCGVASSSS